MKKLDEYNEWLYIVGPIITSQEYLRRKAFRHHGETSVYDHSIKVSKNAYKLAKMLHGDYKSAAIAGALHDFYTTPWQDVVIKQPFYKMHAFTHARDALSNSRIFFRMYLNKKIENAILRHMFPLNIIPPTHTTGYFVTIADKISSLDMLLSLESLRKTLCAPFIRKKG